MRVCVKKEKLITNFRNITSSKKKKKITSCFNEDDYARTFYYNNLCVYQVFNTIDGDHWVICLVTVVVTTGGPVDDQLSSNDSSDENCCDEDMTVFFLIPPLGNFSTVSETDLVDSSVCKLLAFCSRCELAVSLVTCESETRHLYISNNIYIAFEHSNRVQIDKIQ